MSLSYREVADILKIIDASDCDEVILELEGIRLVVRRNAANGAAPVASSSTMAAPAAVAAPSQPSTPAPVAAMPAPSAVASPVAPGQIEIRAPMVGTFYRRPSPQDPPFVEVGTTVAKGQALCLIEVMKLFTTIEAQQAGVVEMICAQDNALVEFDQLLFRIRPS